MRLEPAILRNNFGFAAKDSKARRVRAGEESTVQPLYCGGSPFDAETPPGAAKARTDC